MKKVFFAICAGLSVFGSALAQDSARPTYGSWGFDVAGMDQTVKPGDDFYRYANGHWIERAIIPTDKSAITSHLEVSERIERRLHEIMEESAIPIAHRPHDLSGKVGAFYKAFMNVDRIEGLGTRPIEPELSTVRGSRTHQTLAALMGRNNRDFEATLFSLKIDVDQKHPTRYAVYINQNGLGLPDRDYYLNVQFSDKKTVYQAYVAQLLNLVKWPQAAVRAKDIVDFETRIANVSWTKTQDRDSEATYNPVAVAELQGMAPGFGWKKFLATAGLADVSRVVVAENTAVPKIAAVFAGTSITTLQAWQAFHIADNAAPYLSAPFTDAWFEMHDKELSGQEQQRPRWKRAITAVSGGDFFVADRFGTFGTMGWAVGELYTAKYFSPKAKANIESLARSLVAGYRARLEKLDWMSQSTKSEAEKKLETYTIKVGYPDHRRDYSKLLVVDDDLVGDVRRAGASDWAFSVARLPKRVDRGDWSMTPQTNDAYNGNLRDIVFPAGILEPPYFDANADAAINYGSMGAIIGHELTHGFDDDGRRIDSAGAIRDWWSPQDLAQFTSRAAALGKQYSTFQPLSKESNVHVNGELTMGENIADLGGLTLALDAYEASLDSKPAPIIDGFTGIQRVFLGWAQVWRGKFRDEYLRQQVVTDPHSPRQFRVTGVVRNIDSWYEAFDVKAGNPLYLAPGDRVHIW